jgi:hypothetical protein
MEPALHVEVALPARRIGQSEYPITQQVEDVVAVGRCHDAAPV